MTFEVWQGFATTDAGDVLDGATVTVKLAGTATDVTLYEDVDGAVSLSNPFTTDATGLVRFYAEDSFVDVVATKDAEIVQFLNVRLGLLGALQTVATLVDLPSAALFEDKSRYVEGVGIYSSDGSVWEAVTPEQLPIYILVGGQSNMAGLQTDDAPYTTATPLDATTDPRVQIWNIHTEAWEVWDQTSNPAQYGGSVSSGPPDSAINNDCPAFHLATALAKKTGATVRVFQSIYGGLGLEEWIPQASGSTSVSSFMWELYVDQIAKSGITKFSHVFWHQGETNENDVRDGTYFYKTRWDLYRAALIADGRVKSYTPFTIGQLRDFWQSSGVRLGGPTGVNGVWRPYFNGKLDPSIYVIPCKDLESTQVGIGVDNENHFSRESLARMGREMYLATFFGNRNSEEQEVRYIAEDTTFTIGPVGYFTDRINGKYDNPKTVMAILSKCRIESGVIVRISIEAGDYSGDGWDDVIIEHPDFTVDNIIIEGAALVGTAPVAGDFTGTEASDVELLTDYIPTHITGDWDVLSPCGIVNLLWTECGTALKLKRARVRLTTVATVSSSTGVFSLNGASAQALARVYSLHNSSYGISCGGAANFDVIGSSNVSLYNGTDYFGNSMGFIYAGTKSGATFNPAQDTGFNAAGAAIF
jgi:hypothetical protein